jgi:hypothetical protein
MLFVGSALAASTDTAASRLRADPKFRRDRSELPAAHVVEVDCFLAELQRKHLPLGEYSGMSPDETRASP